MCVVKCIAIILLSISLGCGTTQDWENERFAAAGVREREVDIFFTSFKAAVEADDKKKVASFVSYPVMATLTSGRRRKLRNPTQLIRYYDRIFDSEFKRLIGSTKLTDLWGKSAGVAMRRGELWFAGVQRNPKDSSQYQIKIIAINGLIR